MENQNQYWLHRISHEWDVSQTMLDMGYLTIGWSVLSNTGIEDKANCSLAEFKNAQKELLAGFDKQASTLHNFFNFKENDYVVVPFYKTFSIFRVKSRAMPIGKIPEIANEFQSKKNETIYKGNNDLLYRKNNQQFVDLGFAIKVEPLKVNLSRYGYAKNPLYIKMRYPKTNLNISNAKNDIGYALTADAPINFYENIIKELPSKLLETIKKDIIDKKLEQLIKWYFEKIGANADILPTNSSPAGSDADIIAVFDKLNVVIYVQAKNHDGITDERAVEQISAYDNVKGDDYTTIKWVITTADEFSNEAINLARDKNVRLINGLDFARMLLDVGITDINDAF